MTTSDDCTVRIWNNSIGNEFITSFELPTNIVSAVFSQNEKEILVKLSDKTAHTYSIENRQKSDINPNYNTEKTTYIIKENQIWDMEAKKVIATFSIPNLGLNTGTHYNGYNDETLVNSGINIYNITFNSNKDRVLTESWINGNVIQLWKFSPLQELINKSRSLLHGREFAKGERKQFFIE